MEDLTIAFGRGAASHVVVEGAGLTLRRGETLALVGESGSGKTLTGRAILRILPRGAHITSGRVQFTTSEGRSADLLALSEAKMRKIRGGRIAMIFQEPMSSLSPLHTIGNQVVENLRLHRGVTGTAARDICLETFANVGFPEPERAWSAYPFELSGGLRQRAMIAMAMVCEPELIIADEPTTALDVTTQAQVLDLMRKLQDETGMSMIMVTHDLGVVANMADSVVVMKRGRVVESGPARAVLTAPGHDYTKALIDAAPEIPLDMPSETGPVADPILRATGLSKTYPGRSGKLGRPGKPVRAVSGVEIAVGRRETLAIVGESGSGKSTVAKLLLRAEEPDPGAHIRFRGADGVEQDVATMDRATLKSFRRKVQIVFQDPFSSLSPRMSVLDILTEPLRIHGIGTAAEQKARAAELMARVGLSPAHLGRFPHAFSGGQRQRICIARALALSPEMIICDEPTSALDVSVQAQVLELLKELQEEMGLSYLFISHNLAVVAGLADRVAVMRRGRIVEQAPAKLLFENPRHPYTQALIAASPEPDMDRRLDLAAVARGAGDPHCWPEPFAYHGDAAPGLIEIEPGHFVSAAA
ncbi:ABC transporter ATP-binding protein [Oceanicella sp. SM1341]|uniref:ABC transporter ATP-binding protein n=1 Tax=Oceanicella sp. SM1341 TaxID=1548889 RepID=UPI001E61BF6B|nr:ABC transporter ATP-binding protein [Oceanicella sp. SM1341]